MAGSDNVFKLTNKHGSSSELENKSVSGGNGGGMSTDERISILENEVKHSNHHLARIDETLARIESRINQMPTIQGLWGMIATMLGTALAIAALTFVVANYSARHATLSNSVSGSSNPNQTPSSRN